MTDVMDPRAYIPMPSIIETTHRGERVWDIWTRLLRDRIVFLGTEVNDDVANIIIGQLLILEGEDPDKEITLYINSPGGVITAGLAIYDTMQYIRCPGVHGVPRPGRLHGRVAARGRHPRPAALPAEQPGDDPPAAGGRPRTGVGHRDPRARRSSSSASA